MLQFTKNIFGFKTKKLNKNIVICNDIDVVHDHAKTINKNLKRIEKYKILKKSQYYYEKEYNKASSISLMILKLTAFITKLLLYIKYIFD